MQAYLSDLLTEPEVDPVQQQSVERLLKSAEQHLKPAQSETKVVTDAADKEPQTQSKPQTQAGEGGGASVAERAGFEQGEFQALYFTVAGLLLAVPLTELGGIHQLEKTSPLFGKPDWFDGVMIHKQQKLNVVDTARWVMPQKYDETLAESLNYQYLIMLGESQWGLACESLVNNVTLQHEDIKWSDGQGKRPWLAGLVKEKMCALIHVSELIKMLDRGMGMNDDNSGAGL
ncbi:chemotaxis protein CheW [Saliniradius amylolyticus]|nr:chemotaxis protein CheW [Saliniradius amylolyticus]